LKENGKRDDADKLGKRRQEGITGKCKGNEKQEVVLLIN